MVHRLKLFSRESVDIASRLMPILFTCFMCFIIYSITKSLVSEDTVGDFKEGGEEGEKPMDANAIVSQILKVMVGGFIPICYALTAG